MGNVVKVVFVSKTTLSRRLVVGFATQNSWKMEQRIVVAVAGNVRWTKTLLFSCYWWLWWSSRARVYNLTGEGEIASQTRKKNDIHYCLGFLDFSSSFLSSNHHSVATTQKETTIIIIMVCSTCERKLKRVIAPDPWAQRVAAANSNGGGGGAKKVKKDTNTTTTTTNAVLSSKKRYVLGSQRCTICKKSLHQPGVFCQPCAFQQGKCAMCGVDVQDVSMHNVGGDLERKLKEKTAREKSEKLARLEKLEEEKDFDEFATDEEKRKKKRKKEEEKTTTTTSSVKAAAKKVEPTGATNLVGSLLQQSASAKNQPSETQTTTTWQYDSKSGYYFDATKMQYYDPKSKLYFCCKTNKWLKPENAKPKNGTFKSGTRKPDKFGL